MTIVVLSAQVPQSELVVVVVGEAVTVQPKGIVEVTVMVQFAGVVGAGVVGAAWRRFPVMGAVGSGVSMGVWSGITSA